MPYVSVDVDIDLDEFSTEELIQELESRGHDYNTDGIDGDRARELLEQIYQLRRTGLEYQQDLDKLFYLVLGKIV